MPQFKYQVKKGPGEVNSGVIEAENQRAAVSRLRDMGYFPIRVEEYSGEERTESFTHALTRIRLKDRNLFFRQLANLVESGMPITRALGTLMEQTENPKLAKVIEQIREEEAPKVESATFGILPKKRGRPRKDDQPEEFASQKRRRFAIKKVTLIKNKKAK